MPNSSPSLASFGDLSGQLTGSPVSSASNPIITYNTTLGPVFGDVDAALPTPGSIFGNSGAGFSIGNTELFIGLGLLAVLVLRSRGVI